MTSQTPPEQESAVSPYGASARARRRALGLSVEQLAELSGLSVNAVHALEGGGQPSMTQAITVDGILGGAGLFAQLGSPNTCPIHQLDAAAAELGCWDEHAPLLRWARRLYQIDADISRALTWTRTPKQDVLVPAATLGAVVLPDLTDPRRRPSYTGTRRRLRAEDGLDLDYAADGAVLATLLREHLQLPAGSPIDLRAACTHLGVSVAGAASAPDSWVKTVTLRVAGTALIVLNTRFHESVTHLALGHALGHLLAGDVVRAGILDHVEDDDDHSIHSCFGTSPEACWRATAFAHEALTPLAYVQAASEDALSGADRRSVDRAIRHARVLADYLSVPPLLVTHRLAAARVLTPSVAQTLQYALRLRAPFGGSARQGDRWAVPSEDFALPAGPGDTWMPPALLERAVAAAVSPDLTFDAPHEVRTDPTLPAEARARLETLPSWRDPDEDRAGNIARYREELVARAVEIATGHPFEP